MKNVFYPIAVLVLSFLAEPRFLCAVTDTGLRPPQVEISLAPPENNEVPTELLQVQPELPRGPQDILGDYETGMANITRRISGELGEISRAVNDGQLSSTQGEYLARERYQIAMMQFQLLSACHAILEQAVAQASSAAKPAGAAVETTASGQTLVVQLPFSSLQLNPSLAQYLELTPEQSSAIQRVMASERASFAPLMEELNAARQKLETATRSEHPDQKEIRSLALAQARLLTKVVAENAELQNKISRLMNSEQRKTIDQLRRTDELTGLRVATVAH